MAIKDFASIVLWGALIMAVKNLSGIIVRSAFVVTVEDFTSIVLWGALVVAVEDFPSLIVRSAFGVTVKDLAGVLGALLGVSGKALERISILRERCL